jgi:mitogen-activated protein kinase kinase kinase 5
MTVSNVHTFSLTTTCETEPETPSITRRSSSGGLLSPEVDLSPGAKGPGGAPVLGEAAEHDGFYLLKKDSQRRMTLSRVLSQDEHKICEVWMKNIHRDVGETVLTMVCSALCSKIKKKYAS